MGALLNFQQMRFAKFASLNITFIGKKAGIRLSESAVKLRRFPDYQNKKTAWQSNATPHSTYRQSGAPKPNCMSKNIQSDMQGNTSASPPVSISREQRGLLQVHQIRNFPSASLGARFSVDVFLPPDFDASGSFKFPVLYFNDGQDMRAIHLLDTLMLLYSRRFIPSIVVVAVYAGERLQEYGIAAQPDYRNRGSKAGQYAKFLSDELMPYVRSNYHTQTDPGMVALAGFSLGGLSAIDIVWNHPHLFGIVGVFSGAFWWRSRDYNESDPDGGRILHESLKKSHRRPHLRFWFQTGTMDESDDRNNNGVIDAIDDTLDLIDILKKLGYDHKRDIHYREVKGGIHHPSTWGMVLPEFLIWAFGQKKTREEMASTSLDSY